MSSYTVVVRRCLSSSVTGVLWLQCKWCKMGPGLLLITNRKSNTGFQVTLKSLTLDDFERTVVCQSCGIVDCGHTV